jgi:OmpA-OmpF porin, OOP family
MALMLEAVHPTGGKIISESGATSPGITTPTAPLPIPVAAAACSYLVFFDWDKATLTDHAGRIIREAAESSMHEQYTRRFR